MMNQIDYDNTIKELHDKEHRLKLLLENIPSETSSAFVILSHNTIVDNLQYTIQQLKEKITTHKKAKAGTKLF